MDKWPYLPTALSSLIEPETLSVLLVGCSIRLQRSLTVLDYDAENDSFRRFDPYIERQNFNKLCACFRDPNWVQGGNDACEACDIARAREVIRQWRDVGQNQPEGYICHLGLTDFSALISVQGTPVAVLLAGQFIESATREAVRRRSEKILHGAEKDIHFHTEEAVSKLLDLAGDIAPPPSDFAEQVQREVNLLQQMAEDRYQKRKHDHEQEFLRKLRAIRRFGNIKNLRHIQEESNRLLGLIRDFCGVTYVVLYTNVGAEDTVLTPMGYTGKSLAADLPHFNWRKAWLREVDEESRHEFVLPINSVFKRGIRGQNVQALAEASCAVATTLGYVYRAFMVFGPFVQSHAASMEREQEFLFQVARIVGWSVATSLQDLRLHDESEKRKTTEKLMLHRVRTALTPITTHTTIAKGCLDRRFTEGPHAVEQAHDAIKAASELFLGVGTSVKDAPRSIRIMVEADDLKLDRYPLSVLVSNCAIGFEREANNRGRRLVIEPSVEHLPTAVVDIARLTIAISNIFENAVKYSFPGTTIYVRSLPMDLGRDHVPFVEIHIEDIGDAIPEDKMELMFKRGERVLAEAKMGRIPGTGYGLWESKAVIVAHGGVIEATSLPTNYRHRLGMAYKVTFKIRIPTLHK